jgi:hypothetical protein
VTPELCKPGLLAGSTAFSNQEHLCSSLGPLRGSLYCCPQSQGPHRSFPKDTQQIGPFFH